MDRLSELPDSVIHLIFSFMSMEYVVRTIILSKRWKDLWTSVPCLNFRSEASDESEFDEFRNFVNRTLILWRGTKIQKLSIYMNDFSESLTRDFILWVRFALEHKVEELYLDILSISDLEFPIYPLLYSSLYSSSWIRKLCLVNCVLEVHGKVHWDQLKSLTIEGVSLNQSVLDEMLSGSPKLEILTIIHGYQLSIHSASLKELYLQYDDPEYYVDVNTLMTPSLEVLEISGWFPCNRLLMSVPSLVEATLGSYMYPEDISDKNEMLREIFLGIHHVKKLSVGHWFIEVLALMKKTDLPSPLLNLKSLTVDTCLKKGGLAGFLNLLKISPNVGMLAIHDSSGNAHWEQFTGWNRLGEPLIPEIEEIEFPDSCLMHLRIVKIEWFCCETSILQLIEFVLKHASVLEKMVIEVRMRNSVSSLLAAQKLLRMPRSSPIAEVVFSCGTV